MSCCIIGASPSTCDITEMNESLRARSSEIIASYSGITVGRMGSNQWKPRIIAS